MGQGGGEGRWYWVKFWTSIYHHTKYTPKPGCNTIALPERRKAKKDRANKCISVRSNEYFLWAVIDIATLLTTWQAVNQKWVVNWRRCKTGQNLTIQIQSTIMLFPLLPMWNLIYMEHENNFHWFYLGLKYCIITCYHNILSACFNISFKINYPIFPPKQYISSSNSLICYCFTYIIQV